MERSGNEVSDKTQQLTPSSAKVGKQSEMKPVAGMKRSLESDSDDDDEEEDDSADDDEDDDDDDDGDNSDDDDDLPPVKKKQFISEGIAICLRLGLLRPPIHFDRLTVIKKTG